uniref:Uncharacterized protein n=1 Tax=Mesocestoides corti TaxID=53468 RepID=A0A5K3F2K9_MESCO
MASLGRPPSFENSRPMGEEKTDRNLGESRQNVPETNDCLVTFGPTIPRPEALLSSIPSVVQQPGENSLTTTPQEFLWKKHLPGLATHSDLILTGVAPHQVASEINMPLELTAQYDAKPDTSRHQESKVLAPPSVADHNVLNLESYLGELASFLTLIQKQKIQHHVEVADPSRELRIVRVAHGICAILV